MLKILYKLSFYKYFNFKFLKINKYKTKKLIYGSNIIKMFFDKSSDINLIVVSEKIIKNKPNIKVNILYL
tara:strand:- start:48 stop:257 length:210 start_codon:yes stop_codon:yes gene_type:complete